MTDVAKPIDTQADTQTQQQQQQTGQVQQQQQQQPQQPPQQQQQQLPPQHLQTPQPQPLNIPPNQYQQQPYYAGISPSSPHPQGSPQLGMSATQSPNGFYLPPAQGYPPQNYQYPPQQYLPPQGYPYSGYPPQPGYSPQGTPYQQYLPPQQGYPQPGYSPQPGYPQQYPSPQQPMWPQSTFTGQSGQFGPILKPVSDGYTPGIYAQDYHPKQDAEVIRKALSVGVTTDQDALIHILPFLTPAQLESIHHCSFTENQVVLADLVDKKISSNFKDAVRAVILGPLEFDVWLLHRAMDGMGTNETYLNMVLLGRKNGDIEAIKVAYHRRYKKYLVDEIRKELSGEVEALFVDALEARRVDESASINDAQIDSDVKDLYTAMVGKSEGNRVSEILVTRSDAQILKIIQMYENRFKGKTLEEVVKKKFRGHMEDALLYILQGAKNKALRDAKLLEKTMKGLGTKNEQLSYRLAILHWNKPYLKEVKAAYKAEFPKRGSLASRVEGETSGDLQKFLLALLQD